MEPTVPVSMFGDSVPNPTDPDYWLSVAQSAVRRYCGWHVAPVIEETIQVDAGGGNVLLLPSGRVLEVTSVVSDGRDITSEVEWSENGTMIYSCRFSRALRGVSVTLKHGYTPEEAPDVLEVVRGLSTRAQAGSQVGLAVSQSAGGMSVRYGTNADGFAPGVELMSTDRSTLDLYKITRGQAW